MNNIKIKYNVGDKILFKTKYDSKVCVGTIEKYLVESKSLGHSICYYIKSKDVQNGITCIEERLILSLANNVTDFKHYQGYIANTMVSDVLEKISFNIEVVSVTFDGCSTILKYKAPDFVGVRSEVSECHPDDTFSKQKGIESCLYKAIIKQANKNLKGL